MAETVNLSDVMKSLPSATDASGKSAVLTDRNGTMSKMDLLSLKSLILFGVPNIQLRTRHHEISLDYLLEVTNLKLSWWSEFSTETPVGIITAIQWNNATIYHYTVDSTIFDEGSKRYYRSMRPLLLEMPGYGMYWNPNALPS